jgi:hypothetical protein
LPGANALAYFEKSLLTAVKSFIKLAPGVDAIKLLFTESAEIRLVPGKNLQPSLIFVGWTVAIMC